MAEGRMLKRKISVSEQVADLLNDTHRLLFTWGIAHLDVDGRMSANPRKFKALICPMLDHITIDTLLHLVLLITDSAPNSNGHLARANKIGKDLNNFLKKEGVSMSMTVGDETVTIGAKQLE